MKQIESIKEFDGYLNRYTHQSTSLHCTMTFSVYLPPNASHTDVPALYWLSGLTCSDENARSKAGAQRFAADYGIAIIFPDTSPRGDEIADKSQYDLGQGAGFYLNAKQLPWSKNYQMYTYITEELPPLLTKNLPLIANTQSITGHSMGGHGALICALKNPKHYRSVSAFSPICHPTQCEWGQRAFTTYLGEKKEDWKAYDATELMNAGAKLEHLLIDQGLFDQFYEQKQLLTEHFKSACDNAKQPYEIRMHEGYDHSYHFVATFIKNHIAYHAKALFN